jgi:hypothetical protein
MSVDISNPIPVRYRVICALLQINFKINKSELKNKTVLSSIL